MSDDDTTTRARARTPLRVPAQRRPVTPPAAPALDQATDEAAQEILGGLVAQPWGAISPSVYETGRLVTLAPWLRGHAARVRFLLDGQRPDGGWGGPEGYALVPTLSATEALLTTLRRAEQGSEGSPADLRRAADGGLRRLVALLPTLGVHNLPDTPAIEIIVPALVAELNEHADRMLDAPITGLDGWRGVRLPLPAGVDDTLTTAIRARLQSGADVPAKLLHSLEVAGAAARRAGGVQPLPLGMIGASPAATAAWLGDPSTAGQQGRDPAGQRALRYLETVAERHGGPVPSVLPITAFERSWVLSGFVMSGFDLDVPDDLVASLQATLGVDGTAGGPGLPPDADTTSVTLHALALLGAPRTLDSLRRYETETHFCTWFGERTPSATTNAHVLDALTDVIALPGASPWHHEVADKISVWLCDQQLEDGTWLDKWHASAYYATACSVVALAGLPIGESTQAQRVANSIARSVRWVLDSQRPDGAWGRWDATAEETAYAIQILLLSGTPTAAVRHAAGRAYTYLRAAMNDDATNPLPLWHDKDLFAPSTIVRSTILSSMRLARPAAARSALSGPRTPP